MTRLDSHERFSADGLRRQGFLGFVTVRELRMTDFADVATDPGVYVVTRPPGTVPRFLSTSGGGWFKGRDPTVLVAVLHSRWIASAEVLYVGKATGGSTGRGGLRTRIRQLVDYGGGKAVGHQGGRYLWQLAGADEFLVAWKTVANPTAEETRILTAFFQRFGAYPFANIAGPRA